MYVLYYVKLPQQCRELCIVCVCIGCACNVSHITCICVYKMFGVRKMYFLTKAEFI